MGSAGAYFFPKNRIRPFSVRWSVPKKVRNPGEFMLLSTTLGFSRFMMLSMPMRAAIDSRETRTYFHRGVQGKEIREAKLPGPETIWPNWSIVTKVNPERHMLDHARSNFLSFHAADSFPRHYLVRGIHGRAPPVWFPTSNASMAKSTV